MDKSLVYLITGVFFEEKLWAEIRDFSFVSIDGIRNPIFEGQVWYDDRKGKFVGRMKDMEGASAVSDFKIDSDILKFTKTYDSGSPIYFRFTKANGYWVGDYVIASGARGESKCAVTAVPLSFFTPAWTIIKKPEITQHLVETADATFGFRPSSG